MICKYAIKTESLSNNKNYLDCSIMNYRCPMIRFCKTINNIVNIDNVDKKCKIYINKEDVEYMKQGKYKVIFEKRGKLCIEINKDTAIMINNPFDEIPKGVDLIDINGEYFIKGFEPILDESIIKDLAKNTIEIKPKREYKKK